MTDLPVACSLDAAQTKDRAALIDELVSDALVDQHVIAGGVRSTFADVPGVERRIDDLVEAESRCCAFLTLEVGRDELGRLTLDVTGSEDARPVIEQFFAVGEADAR